jgi:acetolactate synthase-1/3 small subunit
MRHIISILLQNEAGALARVSALFSSRGYNIDSLSVAPTDHREISRLSMVTRGPDEVIDQIIKQLNKLVDVVKVADMTLDDHIERELLLLKVKVNEDGSDAIEDLMESCKARVLDDSPDTYTLELTGSKQRNDYFIEKAGECSEILTVVRSGAMAIARGHNVLSL